MSKPWTESLADEGLVLKTFNGVVAAYDANGMSRIVFDSNIQGKTQAKKGEACRCSCRDFEHSLLALLCTGLF